MWWAVPVSQDLKKKEGPELSTSVQCSASCLWTLPHVSAAVPSQEAPCPHSVSWNKSFLVTLLLSGVCHRDGTANQGTL